MDNEPIFEDPLDEAAEAEGKGLGLIWIVIIAVIIVGFLGFGISTLLRQGSTPVSTETSSETQRSGDASSSAQDNSVNPNSAREQFQQGNAFVERGEFTEAIAAYNRAIEIDPEYQDVYANLGVVYYQLEQLDLAAENYEKALSLDPTDGDVTYNLGALNLQRALINATGPDQELLNIAIDQLNKALELSPELAEPHFTLGVAYLSQQQTDEAIQAFETFLAKDTGKDPRASQEAQNYLNTLKAQ